MQCWPCPEWELDLSPRPTLPKGSQHIGQQQGNPVRFCHWDSNPWYLQYRLSNSGITVKCHFFLLKINKILMSSVGKVCSLPKDSWERFSLTVLFCPKSLLEINSLQSCGFPQSTFSITGGGRVPPNTVLVAVAPCTCSLLSSGTDYTAWSRTEYLA